MDATCPECAGKLEPKHKLELGEIFGCPDCGSRLEVLGLEPLKLAAAPSVEEDWGE
ncbi:Uncharacterised protein [Candidatus Burarchaeum australiense]|nr:Uncharacterised protein [Candidatus Burarchaeum australiense]